MIKTLPTKNAEFNLCHVKPDAMFRGVVNLQFAGYAAGFF